MTELVHLAYYVTWEGIKPAMKKIQAMLNIKLPRVVKHLQSF